MMSGKNRRKTGYRLLANEQEGAARVDDASGSLTVMKKRKLGLDVTDERLVTRDVSAHRRESPLRSCQQPFSLGNL